MPTTPDSLQLLPAASRATTAPTDYYGPLIFQGDPRRKTIAITFDDGPHPRWTPKLLDLLKSLRVHATFFMVGKMVDAHPELVRRIYAEGHELANHTYNHQNLSQMPGSEVQAELRDCSEAVRRAAGVYPTLYRAPGGQFTRATLHASMALRFTSVLWTGNSRDFSYPQPAVIEQRLMAGIRNGGILLCHSGIPQTMQALPSFVAKARAQGYRFVTVTELIKR